MIMKRIVVIISLALAFALSAAAQENGHFQGIASGNYKAIGFPQDRHYTADISLGWRFDKGNYAGLGSGLHYLSHTHLNENSKPSRGPFVEAVPLYADYVHYFFFGKSLFSFYLGMEAGATYEINEPTCNLYSHHRLRPWLNGKFGFDAGITRDIGIFLGINLIAVPGGDSEYMLAPAMGIRF